MPRKQARPASSAAAAAAAHMSNTPTFTSFAAATAHALPDFATTQHTPTTTPWDEHALQILRRLAKRDTTTKQRALSELTNHLDALSDSKPPTGQTFIAAWPPAFRAALEHDVPAVRSATVALMSQVVHKFRRLVQPIFPHILPAWVAATGDLSPSVADTASKSLMQMLHTPAHREKAAAKYATNFHQYVVNALASLAPNSFHTTASAALAVLAWLLDATNTSDSIASIIDDKSNPVHMLVKGINKSTVNAAPAACCLAIQTLSYMKPENQTHRYRAKRFAQVAALAIRNREPAGWDLAITLLRSGWHNTLEDSFSKLQNAVHIAITAALPTGLDAVLPLFDALPPVPDSSKFALSVLRAMRDALNISKPSEEPRYASVSYSLVVLPAFLETSSFAHTAGARRWLSESSEELTTFEDVVLLDYILPTCRLFLAGVLPATPKAQNGPNVDGNAIPRKGSEAFSNKPIQETAIHIARVLRILTPSRAHRAFSCIADSFLECLEKPNLAERMSRLGLVLNNMNELRCGQQLAYQVLDKLLGREQKSTENLAKALAEVLSTRACSVELAVLTEREQWQTLVERVLSSTNGMLKELGKSATLSGAKGYPEDIGTICSWIWSATVFFDIANSMSDVIDTLRDSTSPEETLQVLTLIGRAHKQRRDWEFTASWHPMHDKKFDDILEDAMKVACSTGSSPEAISLITTAVEPNGGYAVEEPVLARLAELMIRHVQVTTKNDALDEIVVLLLRSPLRFVAGDRADVFRNLIATSILRAPSVNSIMEAILTHLGSVTTQEAARVTEMMIDILKDATFTLGQGETVSVDASGIAKVVISVGERALAEAVSLCEKLISISSSSFTADFVSLVPFSYIFGNGGDVRVRTNHLTAVLEKVFPERYDGFTEDIESFIRSINIEERVRTTTEVMDLYISDGSVIHEQLLAVVIAAMNDDPQNHITLRAISLNLEGRLNRKNEALRKVGRIPDVVHMCAFGTNDNRFHEFRSLLEEAAGIIRKDPSAPTAEVAIDIVAASLANPGSRKCEAPRPVWLVDLFSGCLRAARRHFEQSRQKDPRLRRTESRVANLFCNVLKYFDYKIVNEDDFRFWTLRSLDALQSFVRTCDGVDGITQQEMERMGSITSLVLELIRTGEVKGALHMTSLLDEMIHWGSWAFVLLLPILGEEWSKKSAAKQNRTRIDRDKSAALILTAAERGTLLTPAGEIPINAKHLYGLLPHLASSSPLFRKAVLTVLTHGFATELQGATSKSFPDDEKEQVQLATQMIPRELRTALNWAHERDDRQERLPQEIECLELGYFLAWRLFLDLIHVDQDIHSHTRDAAEDLSFRRAGFVYLRANPTVFANFFNKCIEVAVEGSVSEQAAAGVAASQALEVEERAAQGIQLLRHEDRGSMASKASASADLVSADEKIENAIGHAAGVVFSRALQRLPALSRDHMTDKVDRGTFARVESFVKKRVSPLLIAAEIRKVKEWGCFGGGSAAQNRDADSTEGELNARGSIAGREVWATYTFSDVTLEIGMRLPDTFPLQSVQVEARSRVGMSEARWRKTLLGMNTLLLSKDGSLAEAVELWRRNLDKTFQGAEECPICYSVLHPSTAALPKMQCKTCKNLFHSDCVCKWIAKSNSTVCPLCRSALQFF